MFVKMVATKFKTFAQLGICSMLFQRCIKSRPAVPNVLSYSTQHGLASEIASQIKATGPMTFAEYMRQALSHPLHGYYMNKDVFGKSGDFTTSPEISQMFGELLALWCFDTWMRVGQPRPLQLVELGPGRGTLADDILRVLSKRQNIINKADVSMHFVERSPHLSQMQIDRLCGKDSQKKWLPNSDVCYSATSKHGFKCSWYTDLQQVPKEFSFFIANEFFDAMPIHKLQKSDDEWREVLVDIDDDKPGSFRFVLAKCATPSSISFSYGPKTSWTSNNAEYSLDSAGLLLSLANRIVEDGGAILISDYGHVGEKGDTVRVYKKHQVLANPLENPGEVDITADVNFRFLQKVIEKEEVVSFGPITQHQFLSSMGIQLRLEMLLQNAKSPEERDLLISGCAMLCDDDKMGERFKFLSVFPDVLKSHLEKYPPAGFQVPPS